MKRLRFLAFAALFIVPLIPAAQPGTQTLPKIALLYSEYSRSFFKAHYPACDIPAEVYTMGADEFMRYFGGWQRVLEDDMGFTEGHEFDILLDEDMTAEVLSHYGLLILPNTPSLSDSQTRAIQKWVLEGGRLLATFGSGYKDIFPDLRQDDLLKEQKGGTFGLHQLWHDPVSKAFSTYWIDSGVDARITRYEGPTAGLGGLSGDILHYGGEANLLVQRPEQHPDVLGFLVIENPDWKASSPAIISTRQAKGLVVYFAFAPEYMVYKQLEWEASLPSDWPTCLDGQSWKDRGVECKALMMNALAYLMTN